MEYLLLKTNDIPVGVIVQLYDGKYGSIKFGEREQRTGRMKVCEAYIGKRLTGWEERYEYSAYKAANADLMWWCPIEDPKRDTMPWLKRTSTLTKELKSLLKHYQQKLKVEIEYRKAHRVALDSTDAIERAEIDLRSTHRCLKEMESLTKE